MFEASEQFIRSLEIINKEQINTAEHPFNLPVFRNMDHLNFHPKVTFIIGENGMGKSTLLEAIAIACGFNPEGGSANFNFSTCDSHSVMYNFLRLIRGIRRPHDGFFLRAESFYNVASNIDELDRDYGFGPKLVESFGGRSLHEQSHGEAFFALFLHRLRGTGLYILDEPEAALSPLRQLSLLSRIHELVQKKSQLIIATHSPIIMAYPDSQIFSISSRRIEETHYEDTDHFQITRNFINNREKMLSILLED